MRIISLKSENVKRLKAVEITPDGNIVKITGKNGEGKTSVLDSIFWALAGKDAIQSMPIRKGAEKANIEIDLGDYKVQRSITAKGAYIKVTTADGAAYPSPQKLLDSLVGKLSFDPMQFTRMKSQEQGAVLRDLAGLDLTKIDTEEKQLCDQRRDANREAERCAGILEAAQNPDSAPEAETSVVEISAELQQANEANQALLLKRERIETGMGKDAEVSEALAKSRSTYEQEAAALLTKHEREVEDLQQQLVAIKTGIKTLREEVEKQEDIDTEEIQKRLADVEQNNEDFRARKLYLDAETNNKAATGAAENLEKKVLAIRAKRKEMIVTAKYPLKGLTMSDDGGALFGDIPVDQISLAEQIRVSTSIAMALNPNLRVIRITDGSLLDSNSMDIIASLATENDYQVWIEVVNETGEIGFYIEDGQLAAINGEKVDNSEPTEENEQ